MEGEFEKRLKKYWIEERTIPEDSGAELDDMLEIVEEAKKEFPRFLVISGYNGDWKPEDILQMRNNEIKDYHKWFDKWFGIWRKK